MAEGWDWDHPAGLRKRRMGSTSSFTWSVDTLDDWLKLFMKPYTGRDMLTVRASSRFLIQRWR